MSCLAWSVVCGPVWSAAQLRPGLDSMANATVRARAEERGLGRVALPNTGLGKLSLVAIREDGGTADYRLRRLDGDGGD